MLHQRPCERSEAIQLLSSDNEDAAGVSTQTSNRRYAFQTADTRLHSRGVIACDKRKAFAQGSTCDDCVPAGRRRKQSILSLLCWNGLLRFARNDVDGVGARCEKARIRDPTALPTPHLDTVSYLCMGLFSIFLVLGQLNPSSAPSHTPWRTRRPSAWLARCRSGGRCCGRARPPARS
jgi:hypothetical protein